MQALTTREIAALTGLDEKVVRKDVEQGVVQTTHPPRFSEGSLVYFFARALFTFQLSTKDRKRLHQLICEALEVGSEQLQLGRGWSLDLVALSSEVGARREAFERWKAALVVRDDVLGGEPVFPNSRLAVRHVGGMLNRGAPPQEVLEDYPYLTSQDLDFAVLYTLAYPKLGRPRA